MPDKECPICGCAMRLKHPQEVLRIPGNPKARTHTIAEWVCPDCDHFEEAEEAEEEST